MNKISKFMKLSVISALFVMIFTFGFALINVDDAYASEETKGWYFSRVSLKKCDIRLDRDSYAWTGKEIRPMVTVMHEGRKLIIDKDYELKYDNNVDAGLDVGEVKIKGIGNYRSSVTLTFDIIGIDIARECTFQYKKNKVVVFYKGRELDKKNYKLYGEGETRRVVNVTPSSNPREQYVTYEVTELTKVVGKGQFFGEYIYKNIYAETVLEVKEGFDGPGPGHGGNHPGPAPGPGHGGNHPGPAPGPHPAPGPGHGGNHPGPAPGPGHGGNHPGPNPGHGPR